MSDRRAVLVVRGRAAPEEIAAVTAVLLAALSRAADDHGPPNRSRVRWRRPERQALFSPSRSWRR
ncbi:acyl-CoA carboxylase epsilon subunit [Streptomyces sp. NPDC047042]|uniref:acyl-CoA carboxylase epsilon subunit n=1 Tax=Streptomyces sp. NPDC047042 TaxID=3154807 RepID=UPI0033FCBCB1